MASIDAKGAGWSNVHVGNAFLDVLRKEKWPVVKYSVYGYDEKE